ncbi:MAG: hypothetical protein RLZZ70_146 [Candidatus Parcubacteria bacterium]|jgi:hypothetical protein
MNYTKYNITSINQFIDEVLRDQFNQESVYEKYGFDKSKIQIDYDNELLEIFLTGVEIEIGGKSKMELFKISYLTEIVSISDVFIQIVDCYITNIHSGFVSLTINASKIKTEAHFDKLILDRLIDFNINSKSNFISLSNSQIGNIKFISSEPDDIVIQNSSIRNLSVAQSTSNLTISKSNIDVFNIDDIIKNNNLTNFYFSKDSHISWRPEENYRKLRILASKNQLYSSIQQHILHIKEIQSFTTNNKSINDILLFYGNKILNNHGQSFIQPIILMYLVNALLISTINYFHSEIDLSFSYSLTTNLIQAINISALNELEYVTSERLNALDGLRLVLMAIFTYATISAAIKFNFKR